MKHPITHKLLSLLAAACLLLALLPTVALAVDVVLYDGLTITGDAVTQSVDGQITLGGGGSYSISGEWTGSMSATQSNPKAVITVPDGVDAEISLDGVTIEATGDSLCAFSVAPGGTARVTLFGASVLKSGLRQAGLSVPEGAALFLTGGEADSLSATGGAYGAGIGGGNKTDGGAISISGGTVTATGSWAAGIGGGGNQGDTGGAGGTITIGGTARVTAFGGGSGAGIGGGSSGGSLKPGAPGGTITIGGSAWVEAHGGSRQGYGAGIGGGGMIAKYAPGGDSGTIQIGENAVVFAYGGGNCDHIGAGGNEFGTGGSHDGVSRNGGVIFEGEQGAVYGGVTLSGGLTIPDGVTLTVPDGAALTIPDGAALTVESGGIINNGGTISNSGSFTNGGTVNNLPGGTIEGTVDGNSPLYFYRVTVETNGQATATGGGNYQAGDTVTLSAVPIDGYQFDGWQADPGTVTVENNAFSMPAENVTVTALCSPIPITGGSSDDSGPSYERRTLTDKATGVKVAGKQVYSTAKLTVETGKLHAAGDPGCDLLRAARNAGHVLGAWDLTLSKAPKGGVTVSLPVEGMDGKTLTVAHCVDGALVLTDVEVTDGFAAVAADSLSPFAVLDGAYTLADLEALAAPPAENPFTDVAEGDWFYDAALYVYTNGLMTGTTETAFSPGVSMTRGMFVTVLYRLAGSPRDDGEGGAFTDIPAGAYCAAAVDWAAARGIVRGTSDDTFEPDRAVTRQEMAVILANYLQAGGRTLPQVPAPAAFTDRDAVAGWAVDAVEAMRTTGVFQGKDGGRFDPAGTATRAEAAALFQRLAHALGD